MNATSPFSDTVIRFEHVNSRYRATFLFANKNFDVCTNNNMAEMVRTQNGNGPNVIIVDESAARCAMVLTFYIIQLV